MDNIFTGRHKNLTILAIVLTVQFFGLAAQIRRPTDQGTATPLIRTWVVTGITPIEKFFVHTATGIRDTFGSYFFLRGVRKENASLRQQVEQMRLEQVRLQEDAAQGRRLQSLLGFKEQFISETLPAQVIGTSGSDASRVIFIDKGSSDGVKDNMAVITPNGVVGKVAKAFHGSSQVLLISDQSWGAGGILVQSRLQGIVKGTQAGAVQMTYIMADNQIKPGEQIVTSGGDRIFPKGLPLGTVKEVAPGKDMFLNIRVTPAADLNRVEEVLVITKIIEKAPDGSELGGPIRASDILAQRLPSVPQKPADDGNAKDPETGTTTKPSTGAPNSVVPLKTTNPNSTTKSSTGAPAASPATTKPGTSSVPPKTATPKETRPASKTTGAVTAPQAN